MEGGKVVIKIDLHTHTIDTKAGDGKRNVTKEKFYEVLSENKVNISAITNHNIFDKKQYDNFVLHSRKMEEDGGAKLIILPGVELDIINPNNGDQGHLIIITCPEKANLLENWIKELSIDTSVPFADVDLDSVLEKTASHDCLYIGHFFNNHRRLSIETMRHIEKKAKESYQVLYEASQLKSLGILANHRFRGVVGSDVKDWSNYPSDRLPIIRLKIDSFEQLLLLAKKSIPFIESITNRKNKRSLDLTIMDVNATRTIGSDKVTLFQDINVIFGNKGTGKSRFLEAINRTLLSEGKTTTYYNSSKADEELNGKLSINSVVADYKMFNESLEDIDYKLIQEWGDIVPTPVSDYYTHFEGKNASENRKYLQANFMQDIQGNTKDLNSDDFEIFQKLSESECYIKRLDDSRFPNTKGEVLEVISTLVAHNRAIAYSKYRDYLSIELTNKYINSIKVETEKKTNEKSLPGRTKLLDFWKNRIKVAKEYKKLESLLNSEIKTKSFEVGDLGNENILRILETHKPFNDETNRSKEYKKNVTTLKNVRSKFKKVYKKVFDSDELSTKVEELRDDMESNKVTSLNDFIGIKRHFYTNDHTEYQPSSGESKMILLQEKLDLDRDAYILDEPDRSLGNIYVNDIILPKLLSLADQNKTIVLVTHSANLAVRSLPYCSILKEYDNKRYLTYVGSPFSNSLVDITDEKNTKEWKRESINILEGGEEAFLERGDTYNVRYENN
jgi:predicted ATPase